MRRFIIPAVLAALALTAAPQVRAQAVDHTGWYVNAGYGHSHFNTYDGGFGGTANSTGGIFNIGWRKGFIGVEAGYTNVGNMEGEPSITGAAHFSGHGFTTGLNAHFNVTDHFYIGARAGAMFWKLTEKRTYFSYAGAPDTTARYHQSSTGWYSGLAAGYDINRHWSIGGEFNYYRMSKHLLKVNDSMYTATVEYRF